MNVSTQTARQTASDCMSAGMRHVVICPGSRSAPLTYAFAELDRQGLITTHVRIDERSAAFMALGIAKGLRAAGEPGPVGVVTTSGTAVANLAPAFTEAAYAHLPLVALTADRPARLRATGANQTLDDQSTALPESILTHDVPPGEPVPVAQALATAMGGPATLPATSLPGPVHVNIQFDVPLVPDAADFPWEPPGLPASPGQWVYQPTEAEVAATARAIAAVRVAGTVVVAGDTFGFGTHLQPAPQPNLVRRLVGDVPVLAEPTSALFDLSVPLHDAVLSEYGWGDVRAVVRYGKVTLFRPDAGLLAAVPVLDLPVTVEHWPAEVVARAVDMSREVASEVAGEVAGGAADELGDWQRIWRERGEAVASSWTSVYGEHVVSVIAREAPEVLIGSSNAVRYLAHTPPTGAYVHASRGLAGIDGLISTGVGIAAARGTTRGAPPVAVVLGDVSALHDIGGLLTEVGANLPNVQVFVLNDDGGSIFAGLEHGGEHVRPYFDRYFRTRHGRNFDHLATAYGWPYRYVTSLEDVHTAVTGGQPGVYEVALG